MQAALELAAAAHKKGNSPFSCILADKDGAVLVSAENTTKTDGNPLAHAEMNALLELSKRRPGQKLNDVILISPVQSCPMCFSAAYRSDIRNFVYGCAEDDTLVPKIDVHKLNEYCEPKAEIITGILQRQCTEMLKQARAGKTSNMC